MPVLLLMLVPSSAHTPAGIAHIGRYPLQPGLGFTACAIGSLYYVKQAMQSRESEKKS